MTRNEKSALITGVTGQDGWYLAESLRDSGYTVTGTTHRDEAAGSLRFGDHEVQVLTLDLTDMSPIEDLIRTGQFDEVYNLAARASSAQLFDDVLATSEVNGVGVARILEAIKRHSPGTRFCQASSSEVFAGATSSPQDEATPRVPLNAYGAAKAFGDHLVGAYRSAYGLFACSAVLFSHESPRRSPHFVVRKITQAAALAAKGLADRVTLENLDSGRDWGYAPDYVEAMKLMVGTEEPSDYVIATGEYHTVQDVCETAFEHVGLDWRRHVLVPDHPPQSTEPVARVGDASRARAELAWAPTMGFSQLVTHMVDFDTSLLVEPRDTHPTEHAHPD
jgi:GDPmannose 4,6-dehydratase